MLILKNEQLEIQAFLKAGVSEFLKENPGRTPYCVSLYSSPVNGWLSLCIDTVDHGALPRTSCPNFDYPEFRLLERPSWALEYEASHPIVQRHDMTIM